MKMSVWIKGGFMAFVLVLSLSCSNELQTGRALLSLSGDWTLETDTVHSDRTLYSYAQQIAVPSDWKNKQVMLLMRADVPTRLFVNGKEQALQSTNQGRIRFKLPEEVIGTSVLLELVSCQKLDVASVQLEAYNQKLVEDFSVRQLDASNLEVTAHLVSVDTDEPIHVEVGVVKRLGRLSVQLKTQRFEVQPDTLIRFVYDLGSNLHQWDIDHQPFYEMTVVCVQEGKDKKKRDGLSKFFGLKTMELTRSGLQLNGKPIFLNVYPADGLLQAPECSNGVAFWRDTMASLKVAGVNVLRFEYSEVPEIVYSTADQLGLLCSASSDKVVRDHPSEMSQWFAETQQISSAASVADSPTVFRGFKRLPIVRNEINSDQRSSSIHHSELIWRDLLDRCMLNPSLIGMYFPENFLDVTVSLNGKTDNRLMLRSDQSVWRIGDALDVELILFASHPMNDLTPFAWSLADPEGKVIGQGSLDAGKISTGLNRIARIRCDLNGIQKPTELLLTVETTSLEVSVQKSIWVFDRMSEPTVSRDVLVTNLLNIALLRHLEAGGKALLMPLRHTIFQGNSCVFVPQMQSNDSWMLGSAGLMIDADHPALSLFPTDAYADWQWASLMDVSYANPIRAALATAQPIVEVVNPNNTQTRYGLLYEAQVGPGKLLISMINLQQVMDTPEGAQLYKSIIKYAQSSAFQPKNTLTEQDLRQLVQYTVTRF